MSFAGVLITLLLFAMCWVPRNPNRCNFWGAVVGGVLGLIGSRKSNKATAAAHASDTYNNSPQGIRANAEEAGFNPLTVLNSGRSFGAGYSPTFENEGIHLGRAVEAGITALDQKKLQLTQLKKQNNRLTQQMRRTTFDAKSPSVYERRNTNVLESGVSPVPRLRGGQRNTGLDSTDNIPSLLTPWRAENGEIVMLPNPDLPDADQYIPQIAGAAAATLQGSQRTRGVPKMPGELTDYYRPFLSTVGNSREREPTNSKRWGSSPPRSIAPSRSETDAYRFYRNVFN